MPQAKIYNEINLGITHLGISGKKILDVGCGTGLLGAELKKAGNHVFGIDGSPDEIKTAQKRLDGAFLADITAPGLPALPGPFDVLIFADVLEHLADPQKALAQFLPHLKSGGTVIISVPNVACYSMRLGLLFGQFNYKDYGLLDRTHLRFFTKKTAGHLVQNAGLLIRKTDITPYFIRPLFRIWRSLGDADTSGDTEEKILRSPAFLFYAKFIFPVERAIAKIMPSLFAYQFIIVSEKH